MTYLGLLSRVSNKFSYSLVPSKQPCNTVRQNRITVRVCVLSLNGKVLLDLCLIPSLESKRGPN